MMKLQKPTTEITMEIDRLRERIIILLDFHFYLLIKDEDRNLYQMHKDGFIKDLKNALLTPSVEGCTWKEDDDGNWSTTCGEMFVLNDGTPESNSMKYCAYCGGKLIEKRYEVKDE